MNTLRKKESQWRAIWLYLTQLSMKLHNEQKIGSPLQKSHFGSLFFSVQSSADSLSRKGLDLSDTEILSYLLVSNPEVSQKQWDKVVD